MTEIPSCILSQYMWQGADVQIDKTSIQFSRNRNLIMFHNFLITIAPLKNGMNLRKNLRSTLEFLFSMGETSRIDFRKNGNLSSKNKETVANLIAHHHYLIKGSRVIT